MLRPHHVFIRDKGTVKDWTSKYFTTVSALKTELPLNVHLLTFQVMGDGKYLLRLEHQFEKDESPWNNEVSVSLTDLFVLFSIDTVTELGLATSTPRTRLQWKTESGSRKSLKHVPVLGPDFIVVLEPMQIRTFQVTTKQID